MYRKLDSGKAIQAIGVILRNHPFDLSGKLRILKLLYIADREAIQETGRPILGCKSVAMDHGPLHSAVKKLIDGEHLDEPRFSERFDKYGYMLQMSSDPGVGELSTYEIEKLQEVCDRYAALGDWELAHGITHQFAEWKAHYREGTSTEIPLESIIDAVGRSDDKEEILHDLAREINSDCLFGERSK